MAENEQTTNTTAPEVPAGETAESMASVAAAQAKLAEMTKGAVPPARVYNTPTKPAAAAEPTENQKAIKALNAPGDDGIYSKDEAKQKAAVDRLRTLLAAESSDEEKQAIADMPLAQLREQYKVDPMRVLPSLRNAWDEHGEGTILATFAQNGVAPEAVSEVVEFYVGQFNGAVGKVGNVDAAAMEAGARAIFKKHGVAQDVVDGIITFEKQRLGVK